jgi:Chaperone of endosialidase
LRIGDLVPRPLACPTCRRYTSFVNGLPSTTTAGLYATTSAGSAASGVSGHNTGTSGGGGNGVYGAAAGTSGNGVKGSNSSGNGVYGTGSIGVFGTGTTYGVAGETTNATYAVYGNDSGSGYGVYAGSDSSYGLYAYSVSGLAAYIAGSGEYTGTWTLHSDERLKKNIAPLTGALEQLLQLRGVTFEWKNPEKQGNATGTQRGFIAQEYEKIFPGWVKTDNEGFKSIDTISGLAAVEVEAIRELKLKNDALQAKYDAVLAKSDKLERRLDLLTDGRDPISGGPGVGTVTLALMGLGLGGFAGISRLIRRKREGSERSVVRPEGV